ncbi:RNA-binding protein 44 [Sceloporus undulatus]|uniref:RNA-binding protein 44 n=1 Tax=Sceloporus undulatus TaxID=8520 RepID=UPI001C4C0592|nr:RNA-binding protein 44 [Sceloporus undulatus]XP_042302553.1 RNA-binding protein 44 [Sceloporus undulatus]
MQPPSVPQLPIPYLEGMQDLYTFVEKQLVMDFIEGRSIINVKADTKAVLGSHQLASRNPEISRLNKGMVSRIASGGHSNARTLEQRGSRVEKNEFKSTVCFNAAYKQEHSEKSETNNSSSEHQAGANCSISDQSCYLSTSELNLTKENLTNMSSSVDEEHESLCKEQQKISIPPEDATEGGFTIPIHEDLPNLTDIENDYRCSDLDDDSQLEYHSAEEEECVCCSSSYAQQRESLETFNDKKLPNEHKLTGGQPQFNKLEDELSNTSCSAVSNYCSFSEKPEFSKTYQDGKGTSAHYLNSDDQERDESEDSLYREKNSPESSLICKSEIDEKTKVNSLTDTAWTYKMSTNRGLFKKTDNSSTNVSQRIGNPHVLHQERTLALPVHTYSDGPDISDSCAHEQSVVLNTNEICTCKLHGICKENFPNTELNGIASLNNIVNKNQSTVNQAVDATSDFRACFTTSRATNVKASMVTRGQNTVITMMSKHRPNEWLTDSHRSVGCNTDWSCMSEKVEAIDSQIAVTDILEHSCIGDTAKHGWKRQTEDPLECENSTSKDLNEIPNRLMHLSQEISDHLPDCCKEIWQRAIKAEMQLLKIRYQMYHQHCWRTFQPVMKEKEHAKNSGPETGKLVSQVSLPENMETSSHSLVTHQMSEKQCLSNKNAEERKNDLVENESSNSQEITEHWFDATQNLAEGDSLPSLTETQTIDDQKKASKDSVYVHVGNLGPLVSEVDLLLNFQKYNVSEISICEPSDNYRYASLSFKSAHEASLAVKEMNDKLIKGKAVNVQLLQTVKENGVPSYKSSVKQEHEDQRGHSSSDKNTEHKKNCNMILEMPPPSLAAPRVVSRGPVSSSKRPEASKEPLKLSLPDLSNTPASVSASSEIPFCLSSSSKVPDPKPSSRNPCFDIDQEDVADSLLPLGSVQDTPNPSSTFVPPNTLNLRSFRKVVKKLEELHPKISRDIILDALVEIKENTGFLSGLPLCTIVQMTSSLLKKKFASQPGENKDTSKK